MGVPENIDALLVMYDITQDALARIAGVTPGAVTGWRRGSTPRDDAIEKMCSYFGITKDDIISNDYGLAAKEHSRKSFFIPPNAIMPRSSTAYAPLLGRVHAGTATEPDILDEHIPVPQEIIEAHPHGYYLEVEGDCMDKVYPPGCHIFVDPDRPPGSGSIAAVMLDGHDAVMRKLYRGADTMVLSPCSHNTDYTDIVIRAEDEHTVELVGTVVWFQAAGEME